MHENLNTLHSDQKAYINDQIGVLLSKLKTITPTIRQKRGLFNFVGNAYKYLFGTMDDTDREDITNHLNTVDSNIHNSITGLNQQIKINNYFNKTIQLIKDTITQNKNDILYHTQGLHRTIKNVLIQNIYLEKLLMLTTIKNHIEHIQSYITTAQNGISDASILTDKEINDYEINISKIMYLRTAIFQNNNDLIFIIKVPKTFNTIHVITIVPIPNPDKEINTEIEEVFEYDNKIYTYRNNKYINEYVLSKHCIINKTCQLIKNENTEILNINDYTIVMKNAKNNKISNNCGSENKTLLGNVIIQYNNCTIEIAGKKFSNNIKTYIDKIILPQFNKITFNTTLTLEELKLTSMQNLKEIEEIKYNNKIVTYSVPIIIVVISVLVSAALMYCHCGRNNGRIQENPPSKGGGVTYILPQLPNLQPRKSATTSDIEAIMQKYLSGVNDTCI